MSYRYWVYQINIDVKPQETMSSPKPALTWYSVMAVPCVSPQAATRTRESKTPMRGVGLDTTLQRCARAAACVEARRSALMPLMRAACTRAHSSGE